MALCNLLRTVQKTPSITPRSLLSQPHMHGTPGTLFAGAANPRSTWPLRSLGVVVGVFRTFPGGLQASPHAREGRQGHPIQFAGWSLESTGLDCSHRIHKHQKSAPLLAWNMKRVHKSTLFTSATLANNAFVFCTWIELNGVLSCWVPTSRDER